MSDLRDAIDAYHASSSQLSDLYRERSEALAAEVTTRARAYTDLCAGGDRNITQIREEADFAAHTFKAEALKISGEIDALSTRLRWLDVWINHLRADNHLA